MFDIFQENPDFFAKRTVMALSYAGGQFYYLLSDDSFSTYLVSQ